MKQWEGWREKEARDWQTNRKADRQTDRQTERQTEIHTYILTHRQMAKQINTKLTLKQLLPIVPNKRNYYMASSASRQDDPNRALWLATRAGKMDPSCPLRTTRCIPQAKLLRKPYNKSFIDQVCSVKMAGYWPRSSFASLWTSTLSRSINTQKKNSANIQPSWPHTRSITHTYYFVLLYLVTWKHQQIPYLFFWV